MSMYFGVRVNSRYDTMSQILIPVAPDFTVTLVKVAEDWEMMHLGSLICGFSVDQVHPALLSISKP
jgi:hypothetical protein